MYFFKKTDIGREEDGTVYLTRYTLFGCKYFTIKVHHIMKSDYDCLHDHPWTFISLLLKGSYIEHTEKGSKKYKAGNLLYRPAPYKHRLEIDKPVWSLVITFRKKREWGFWTKSGWIPWKLYNPTNSCE